MNPDDPHWRDVVTALCKAREYRLAEIAQRHAVPVLQDLIGASRTDQVKDMFGKLRIEVTAEQASDLFERYIYDVIRKFQTLNCRRSSILDQHGSSSWILPRSLQPARRRPTGKPR